MAADFVSFDSWDQVLEHVRARKPTWYQAPMDHRPVKISVAVAGVHTVRVIPPSRDVDPFTADLGHLNRFRRQPNSAERRVDRLVSAYLNSSHWDTNRFGCSSDMWIDDPERAARCERAAESGADGSTHAEYIDDMRKRFADWLRERHRGKLTEFYWRIDAAVSAHFDRLESWHEANGTLEQEIG